MTVEIRYYVIDTGYLDEYFKVGNKCKEDAHTIVRSKIIEARRAGHIMCVPVPVLFEVANHIAQVASGARRRELVEGFSRLVQASVANDDPWIITPPGKPESIQELMLAMNLSVDRFAKEFSAQEIGLTDTVVIMEAERLKQAHPSSKLKRYYVHIWTTDAPVKAREPDTEPNPFP